MQPDQGKKQADAGRKVGDASDFLGLTTEEQAYIELRLKSAGAPKGTPSAQQTDPGRTDQ